MSWDFSEYAYALILTTFDLEPFLLASRASNIFSEFICVLHLLVKQILVVVLLWLKSGLDNLLYILR